MSSLVQIVASIIMIIVPLFGGVGTVYLFYRRDEDKEPKDVVIRTFLWGLLAGAIIISVTVPLFFGVDLVIENIAFEWAIILFMIGIVTIQALFEEILKWYFLHRKCKCLIGQIDGFFDAFFYGAIIGTGAGVVDAIVYAVLSTDWLSGLSIAFIRTVRLPGTHALFTGIVGIFCAKRRLEGKKAYPGVAAASGLHSLWNIGTFLIYHFLEEGLWFQIANYSYLALYLVLMSIVSGSTLKYDHIHFPNGGPEEIKMQAVCKIPARKLRQLKKIEHSKNDDKKAENTLK